MMDADPGPVRAWLARRWLLLLGLAALCVVPRLLFHHGLFSDDYDTGIYHNLAWNLAHGHGFRSDILGHAHSGEHWNPIVAAFAPLYLLWPSAHWLMAAQGLAIAATLAGCLWLAERSLAGLPPGRRRFGLAALAVLALCYPPLWSAWWHDFQPIVLGAPCIVWAMIALHRGRGWAAALCVGLLLLTRESAVLAAIGLAWYAWRVAERPRAAVAIATTALVIAAVVFGLVMPLARDGAVWGHAQRAGVAAMPGAKLMYLLALVGQLALLPLLAPRLALAAMPGIALNLAVAYPAQFSSAYHYDAQIAPFLLVAAAAGMARLLALPLPERSWWLRVASPLAVCAALAIAWGGLPLADRIDRLAERMATTGAGRTMSDLHAIIATAGIAADEAIAADPQLGPHLAGRSGYHALRTSAGSVDEACVRDLPSGTRLVVQRWWWQDYTGRVPAAAALVGEWPEHWNSTLLVLRRK